MLLACIAGCGGDDADLPGVRVIGGPGRDPGRFATPRAVTARGDRVVVVDRSGRIQEFARDGTFRREVRLSEGRVGFPIGAQLLDDGGLLVVDTHNARLRWFGPDLAPGRIAGDPGTAPGCFQQPQRAAIGPDGELYVTEYRQDPDPSRVQVFDRAGAFLRAFGAAPRDQGGLSRPIGIAVRDDEVFVADVDDRILVYGRSDGALHRQIGTSGKGPGELRYPFGLCLAGDLLIVAEYGNHRIQRFDPATGASRGTFGSLGSGSGEFRGPWDVCADAEGLLYVADTGNDRVVVIDPRAVRWE